MGTVFCVGKVIGDTGAEVEAVGIDLPPPDHVYTVSQPVDIPVITGRDGRDYLKYRARVLDHVIVLRRVGKVQ